jgi:hypothetical protein
MVLWILLIFMNPYSNRFEMDSAISTFVMLFLPACLAVISVLTSKKTLMLLSFFWSLPASLYLVLTPGIFAFFGATTFAFLITYLLMRLNKEHET